MKGVSAIIATILMLVITIALAGLAYSYMSGILTSRTAVVLSIDASATQCSGDTITVFVKNDGTSNATVTAYSATSPGGVASTACGSAQVIQPGTEVSFTCTKTGGPGYYPLRATAAGASASGSVYCAS
ncbi:MAG: archaellin/type IV pilin N-terminal domain-containing protein [Candidatus Heimdallarchaeota archaeon]